ncbi:hypothetical protein AVEN_108461-1 [Araneus ventricosus]|uniref:Uncharacterized protein n=1 Tax=Araneus ventricosus TaxID=182803 RepID=A0A4Y2J947_ARAVE|nr:hypothetical protein AVEN_108461-1 [Araneus ventricosus]
MSSGEENISSCANPPYLLDEHQTLILTAVSGEDAGPLGNVRLSKRCLFIPEYPGWHRVPCVVALTKQIDISSRETSVVTSVFRRRFSLCNEIG